MRAFSRRYLDSLVGPSGPSSYPGRPTEGYSFGQRYWASLTGTKLPPRAPVSIAHAQVRSQQHGIATPGDLSDVHLQEFIDAALRVTTPVTSGKNSPKAVMYKEPARQEHTMLRFMARSAALSLAIITTIIAVTGSGSLSLKVSVVTAMFAIAIALFTFSLRLYSINSLKIKTAVALAAIGAIIAVVFVFVYASEESPRQSLATITSPVSGIVRVTAGERLQVTGTVRNIPPGHHIWLLAKSGSNPTPVYATETFTSAGRWTAFISVTPGVTQLILADLTPDDYSLLLEDMHQTDLNPNPYYSGPVNARATISITVTS